MSTPLSDDLLALLRCPVTQRPLRSATTEELLLAGPLLPGGSPEGGLVTEDGRHLYPIRDGLPYLVEAERVVLPSATPSE